MKRTFVTLAILCALGVLAFNFESGNAGSYSETNFDGASPLLFEGATADDYETTLSITDPTADRTLTVPNLTGSMQLGTAASALTAGATVAVDFTAANVFTLTPGEAETINATAGASGTYATIIVTTSGTSSYNLTFSTNFKTTGVLATGTADAKVFTITFVSDGTTMYEVTRTAAM